MRGLKSWIGGLNLTLTLILIGFLFIFVNFIGSRRYFRIDLSKEKISRLSEKTLNTLKQLNEPVRVIVFYQPVSPEGAPDVLYPLISDLLKEYERQSDKIKVEYFEPLRDRARAEALAKQFNIDRINLVIFQSGDKHKYFSDADIAEYDYSQMNVTGVPKIKSLKAEDAFTSAILSVTQKARPSIWISSGHGEKSVEDTQERGISGLIAYLEKENMSTETVNIIEKAEIPSEVSAVMICGPSRRFAEREITVIESYLKQGGKLLAMIDPMENSGLEDLLNRWGIALKNDVVVDPASQIPFVSPANLLVATYTQHHIVEHMDSKKLITLFPLTRSVSSSKSEGIDTTLLAMTSEQGWGETEFTESEFRFDKDKDNPGPVAIAAASESSEDKKARIVVIGDSDFLSNGEIKNAGNLDFALAAFHWLVEQEQLIGISPKELESIKLKLTEKQMKWVRLFCLAFMPAMCLLLGIGMWLLRRH